MQYVADPRHREYFQLPEETLVYKGGDCDDLAILTATMLQSIGIDASIGLTHNHAFVRAKVPDASIFVKINSHYLYLDPTSKLDFGKVPFKHSEIIRFLSFN